MSCGGSAAMAEAQQRLLIALSRDVRELSLGCTSDVARIQGAPDPLRFLRDFVLPNRPCIITDAISHWPALTLWSNSYLLRQLAHCNVSCHFTPDGRADAIVQPQPLSQSQASYQSQTQTQTLAESQAQALSPYQSQTLTESQVQALSPSQPQTVSRSKSQTLAESEAQALSPSQSQALTESQVQALSPSHSQTLSQSKSQTSAESQALVQSQAQCQFQAVSQSLVQCQGQAQSDAAGDWHPVFASALVEELPFAEALEHVLAPTNGRQVAYLQQQNNCFLSEFAALANDADAEIAWASEALGCKPDAVNLWIGSPESVTSFHKDHYENLYAVVSGEKHFTLLPPTDVHRMYVREYPTAHYKRTDSGHLVLELDSPSNIVPWVSVDPFPKSSDQQREHSSFPNFFEGPLAFECTVRAGELLYLPSLWFHHVRQTPDKEGRTIALNYWYDMQFDIKYAYYNLVEALSATI